MRSFVNIHFNRVLSTRNPIARFRDSRTADQWPYISELPAGDADFLLEPLLPVPAFYCDEVFRSFLTNPYLDSISTQRKIALTNTGMRRSFGPARQRFDQEFAFNFHRQHFPTASPLRQSMRNLTT